VGKVLQKGARKEITESTGASGWKVTQAVKPTDEWYTKEFDDKAWGSAVENASSTTLEYAAPDDSGKYVDRKQIAVKPIWNKVKTSELPPPEPPKPRNLVPDSAGRGAVPAPSNNITTPSAVPSQPSTVQPVPGVQPKPLEVTPPTGTTPVSPAPVSPVDSGRSGSVIDPNASGRGSAGADSLGIKAAADSAGKLMTADSAKTGDSTGSGAKKPAKKSTKKKKSASLDTFNGRPDVATVMLFVETHEWAQSKKKRPAKKPAATTEKKDETPAPPPEPPKEDVKNVYFRKEFIVEDGAVEVAQLVIYDDLASATASDGSVMEIYLNNDPVENPIIDSLNTKQKRYDVTPYVTPGRNVLALKVPVDTKSDGLKAALNVTYFGKLTEDQIKQLIKFDKEQRKKSKIKESTN
ncbi:MAG: hypothetical protein IAF08_02945, partial [Rhizobacter sp.]|nr:hypothetical protein [Chlorobiales bacterium]